jgi:hypothetical protein
MKANNLKTEISWSYSIKRGFIEDETFVAKALFTPIDFEIIDLTKDEIITKIEEKVSSLGAKKLIGLLFNPSFCEENALDDEHCQVMAPYLLYYSFYYPEVSSQVIPLVNLEPSNAVSVKTISTIGKLPDNVEKEIGVTLLKTISEVEALDYRVQKAVLSSVLRLVSLHIEGSADLASKYFKSLQPAAIQENDTSMIDLLDELLPFASEVLKSELTELYAPLKKKSPADLMASLFDDD